MELSFFDLGGVRGVIKINFFFLLVVNWDGERVRGCLEFIVSEGLSFVFLVFR